MATSGIALYAGSFDPITNGHLDVIRRAAKLFDKLIVTVARNAGKSPMFSTEERIAQIREVIADIPNVEVATFEGLLKDALDTFGAIAVVRGLRSVSDFEYEIQMAMMNRELNPRCETVFLMPSPEMSFVSSRMVREIAIHRGPLDKFVPNVTARALHQKFGRD